MVEKRYMVEMIYIIHFPQTFTSLKFLDIYNINTDLKSMNNIKARAYSYESSLSSAQV